MARKNSSKVRSKEANHKALSYILLQNMRIKKLQIKLNNKKA